MGYNPLYSHVSGPYNTAIGRNAGYTYGNNDRCTYVGTSADATISGLTNATAIGNGAKVNASNKIQVGSTSVAVIGGQVGWSTFSDGRFKKDIQQNVPGLVFINKLNPVTYHINHEKLERFLDESDSADLSIQNDFTKNDKKLHTGFVAQEIEQAAKEINYDFDGVNHPQHDKDNYSVVYADFVPSLVKAVQELSKKVDEKDKLISDLQSQEPAQRQLAMNRNFFICELTL